MEESGRLLAELAAVQEIGKVLTSTLEVPEVLQRIMDQISQLLSPRRWSMLLNDEEGELHFELVIGAGGEMLKGRSVPAGEGIVGWVAQHGAPLLLEDVTLDERFSRRFDEETGFETKSVLAVPMEIWGKVLGVIELVAGQDDVPFSQDDLRILSSISDYAAIAIENARNYDRIQTLTIRDDHTGLYNARFLFQTMRLEVERAGRYLHPVSLVFLDLDHFKQVNDTQGHLSGSALLREVGRVLENASRGTDTPCRYGGDEFVVVLPETGRDGAIRSAERMRTALREHHFLRDRGLDVTLTASFGVATFPDDAKNSEDLLQVSDAAMYRAKETGRDRVCRAKKLPPVIEAESKSKDASSSASPVPSSASEEPGRMGESDSAPLGGGAP